MEMTRRASLCVVLLLLCTCTSALNSRVHGKPHIYKKDQGPDAPIDADVAADAATVTPVHSDNDEAHDVTPQDANQDSEQEDAELRASADGNFFPEPLRSTDDMDDEEDTILLADDQHHDDDYDDDDDRDEDDDDDDREQEEDDDEDEHEEDGDEDDDEDDVGHEDHEEDGSPLNADDDMDEAVPAATMRPADADGSEQAKSLDSNDVQQNTQQTADDTSLLELAQDAAEERADGEDEVREMLDAEDDEDDEDEDDEKAAHVNELEDVLAQLEMTQDYGDLSDSSDNGYSTDESQMDSPTEVDDIQKIDSQLPDQTAPKDVDDPVAADSPETKAAHHEEKKLEKKLAGVNPHDKEEMIENDMEAAVAPADDSVDPSDDH